MESSSMHYFCLDDYIGALCIGDAMKLQQIFEYCLSKKDACLEFPFGEMPAVVKVEGRIYAEVYRREINPQITLKCEPVLAVLLRQK